jgi:GNAT superfamily N-acetyltransferase
MGIRTLGKEDIDFAVSLTIEEGWNYTPGELNLMQRLDPGGSFIYEEEEPLGFATCVTYGRTGVLGHLVVSKKGRGRKIGNSLIGAALDYMTSKRVKSTLVYATQEAIGLYKKHGFAVLEETSCIHLKLDETVRREPSPDCLRLNEADLPEVIRIDAKLFGDDRGRLIEILYKEAPERAFKIERAGRIAGFIFCRPDHIGYNLGPWVCLTGKEEDADALLRTAASTCDVGKLYMGAFTSNPSVLGVIHDIPRFNEWRVPLMVKGDVRYRSDIGKVFGIAAYELG